MDESAAPEIKRRVDAAVAGSAASPDWPDVRARADRISATGAPRTAARRLRQMAVAAVVGVAVAALAAAVVLLRPSADTVPAPNAGPPPAPSFETVRFTTAAANADQPRAVVLDHAVDFRRPISLSVAIDWDTLGEDPPPPRRIDTEQATWVMVPDGTVGTGGPDGTVGAADLRPRTGGRPWIESPPEFAGRFEPMRQRFADPVTVAARPTGSKVVTIGRERRNRKDTLHTRVTAPVERTAGEATSTTVTSDIWTDGRGRLVESIAVERAAGREVARNTVTVFAYDDPNFERAWGPIQPPAPSDTHRVVTYADALELIRP